MINFVKKHFKLFEVILIFFLSLVPLLWLRDNQIVLGHDTGFRFNPARHLINLFYSWDPSSNFGTDWSWFKGFIVTQAPEAFFISLTNSFVIGQKLTFIFWFFSIGISMYIFVNAFFKEKEHWFFRVFASTFYMYNFFLLQAWFIAERAKFSLFCVLPLGILFIYKTLTREYSLLKGAILFSLISFLFNAGGNATFYGTLLLAYGVVFIFLTIVNIKAGGYREIVYSIKAGFIFTAGFLTVNSYWILPQLYSFVSGYGSNLLSVGGVDSIIAWESVITQNASFINLLRLQGIPDWYDNSLHTYASFFVKNPFLVIFSFIPAILLFLGLLRHEKLVVDRKKNKLVFLILLLLLSGLVFAAGSHPPFGTIYIFLIKHVPGFAIFRSAFYKFGGVLWFSYIFVVSFYLSLFLSKITRSRKAHIFLAIFSFGFLLAYHFPFFNSNFFIWNKPFTTKLTVPDYVKDMVDYINKIPVDERFLILPEFDRQADSYQWGFWGIDSLPRLFTNRSIIANSANYPEIISAIYYSISQNEEDAFLRLVGSSGITRVLWRNDVLYSDKTRASSSFISVRKNLENFKGVRFEKKIGEWSLYEIESPYHMPIVHSVDSITYARSDQSRLQNIFSQEENFGNSAVLFDQSMADKDRGILSFSNKEIIGANCIACGSENFNKTKGGLLMPEVKILPSSPFYYLVLSRQQQVQEKHKDNPALRIDADLGYSNKRIAEMKEIANAKVKNDNERAFVTRTVDEYVLLVKDALEQANTLPEDERNKAFMKISIYLNSQFWYLSVQKNLYDYALEDFERLSVFIQETINNFGDKIWATNFTENKIRYFLSLDRPGIYDLHVMMGNMRVQAVTMDGEILTEFKNLALDEGIHRIEISHPDVENLIDVSKATGSGELRMQFGERMKLPIRNFNPKKMYFVNFDYKITQGRPNASVVEKGKDKQRVWDLLLNQNSVWNSFSSVFEPNRNTESANLEFYPTGFETTGATIQIKNVKVVSIYVPEAFVSRNVSALVKNQSPEISFERLSPTMYKVNVGNSIAPFTLAFGESYNKGWRAYIADDFLETFFAKPIPETQHYTLNGYSNGWMIDKKGNYSIVVEYFPQKIFYLGLAVSGLSFFIIVLILVAKGRKLWVN